MASKNNRPLHPDAATDAIIKVLEPLTYGRSGHQVFADWIEVVEASLMMLPHHAHSLAMGQGMAEDPAPVQALWARMNQEYSKKDWDHLQEAFAILLNSTHDRFQSIHYGDTLGEV